MRILIINPNTSEEFTSRIAASAAVYASPGLDIVCKTAVQGPRSIECVYDELLSAQGALQVFLSEIENFDGFVFACYSDHPIISAAREISRRPVIGIAEASMLMACMIGRTFGIVTTNDEWRPLLADAVRHFGLDSRCASIRSTGLPVLALEGMGREEIRARLLECARAAVDLDGAEVICLGCAGMTGLDQELSRELRVPVLDGVVCALKMIEALAQYGVETSKAGAYTAPREKPLLGLDEIFLKGYRHEYTSSA